MRKVTREAVNAFRNGRNFSSGNTIVKKFTDGSFLYLHGNLIARQTSEGLEVRNAGWFSNTTKERLNGLPGVSIYQKNFTWFLNGEVWNGEWKKID